MTPPWAPSGRPPSMWTRPSVPANSGGRGSRRRPGRRSAWPGVVRHPARCLVFGGPQGGKMADIGAQALSGVKVLDLTRFPPGQFCTVMLADLGADVVRIDAPGW